MVYLDNSIKINKSIRKDAERKRALYPFDQNLRKINPDAIDPINRIEIIVFIIYFIYIYFKNILL